MLSLGIDLGYAKIKLCLGAPGRPPRLLSRPLPYDARRPHERADDIARGVQAALDECLGMGPSRLCPSVAVLVTSAGYAYRSHRQGVIHAAELLCSLLPGTRSFLLGATLEPLRAEDVRHGSPAEINPLALSNPCGAAWLARRLGLTAAGQHGLATDTGGQTTGTILLDGERGDPAALALPERYAAHRAEHGKLVWVGVETTALDSLATEVIEGERRYEVTGRGIPFCNVSALLDLVDPVRSRKLALFGLWPGREQALRAVADAVGLDLELASEDELFPLARRFHELAIERLADGFRRAIATTRPAPRAFCFGLGAAGLARPALRRAGVEERDILLGSTLVAPEHAEAASCFGPWHLGLELATQERQPIFGAQPAAC